MWSQNKLKFLNKNLNPSVMKKLLIFLFILGSVGIIRAQKTTASMESPAFSMPLNETTNSMSFVIPEVRVVAFYSNPLKYVKNNFDIQQLIEENDSKYDSYYVYFRSPKGRMVVNYDKEGNPISTKQKFKDVVLPHKTGLSIYRDYKGWDIVGNKYVAVSRNGEVKKEFYKVKLQNGKKNKTLKIEVDNDESMLELALNTP